MPHEFPPVPPIQRGTPRSVSHESLQPQSQSFAQGVPGPPAYIFCGNVETKIVITKKNRMNIGGFLRARVSEDEIGFFTRLSLTLLSSTVKAQKRPIDTDFK